MQKDPRVFNLTTRNAFLNMAPRWKHDPRPVDGQSNRKVMLKESQILLTLSQI